MSITATGCACGTLTPPVDQPERIVKQTASALESATAVKAALTATKLNLSYTAIRSHRDRSVATFIICNAAFEETSFFLLFSIRQ